jgi:hypothetical protein
MKTPSTFLFDLVSSLTKSQKRYIKVQAGSKGKDYIELMDALLNLESYNEENLIRDYQGANFLKNLAVNKQYLYELLLKSLAHFGQKRFEYKIFQKITATNILIEKGMFQAAIKELKKGQRLAEKYELFEMQLLIYSVEKRLLSNRQFKKKAELSIMQIFEAESKILDQLKNTNEYWYLAQQIAQFQLKYQKIQTEEQKHYIEGIIQSPSLKSISLTTNFKSKIYFFQANATYQFMLGNVEKAYDFNKQFLDLLESNPNFLKLYAERYLGTLNNMLIDSLIIGKYDILEQGITRLIMIPKRQEFKSIKNIESRVFRQRYLLLLNWSLSQKEFDKAIEWIPEIEAGLKVFGTKIEKHHRITFYYLNAYLLFQNQSYDQALQWNNLILNTYSEDVVKEIFYFARVLNLLIHYELGNYPLLESLLQSTPKYLKSRRAIYATEKILFRFLGKSLKCVNKTEKQQVVDKFKKEIYVLFESPKEKRVFNYLDLRLWIERI